MTLPFEKDAAQASGTLRSLPELARAGLLPPQADARLTEVAARYAIAVTPHVASLIADPEDAIARQYLPDAREAIAQPGESGDPTGDFAHMPVKGIVHRYPDRLLLKPLHACAVYCRFCFRREMVGPGGDALDDRELAAALEYIRAASEVREVILTGGDPLLLSPRRIAACLAELAAMPHLRALRIHSRIPVADPARITPELAHLLGQCGKPLWLAIHANHPRELESPGAARAIRLLSAAGLHLLGQSVLLKGVNDDAAILAELFWRMIELGIKPYYLHQLDAAPGTAHFRVPVATGRALLRALRGRIPGYALPSYMLDIPGGFGKVPVGPDYYDAASGTVRDPRGAAHNAEF